MLRYTYMAILQKAENALNITRLPGSVNLSSSCGKQNPLQMHLANISGDAVLMTPDNSFSLCEVFVCTSNNFVFLEWHNL